jgi:hypothetical protein
MEEGSSSSDEEKHYGESQKVVEATNEMASDERKEAN